MKYLLGLCLIFLLQSCDIYDSYLVNEYLNFPMGLDKKQLQQEVVLRNEELKKNSDSLVPFSSLSKKKLMNRELYYFNNTFIPLNELKSVDSLVDLLTAIPKRKWMWSNMDYKIYGVRGQKFSFSNKITRIKTNAKVEDIMNQLKNKLKFKYNNKISVSYYYYSKVSFLNNSISKRLKKMDKEKFSSQ